MCSIAEFGSEKVVLQFYSSSIRALYGLYQGSMRVPRAMRRVWDF